MNPPFYFDPVCPFAWMTSKWVRMVAEQRDYRVDWRFISLRLINADVDYDAQFPAGYEAGHTAGLRLLRVAARVRADFGRDAVGPLYAAIGHRIFDTASDDRITRSNQGSRPFLEPILRERRLPLQLLNALDDTGFDADIRAETNEALALTGKDVGTPILHFHPSRRGCALRAGYQPPTELPGGRAALGQRDWSSQLSRLRRTQTQPAGTTPTRQLRRHT